MIARVTLDLALDREFDYTIPAELEGRAEPGARVKVSFGPRQVLGLITGLAESSPHSNLKPILRILGDASLVTPGVLGLARWIAAYYCCAVPIVLKSMLPDAVRKEEEGWRERLHVHALSPAGAFPKLTKRQDQVWRIIEECRSLPLQKLIAMAETTPAMVRRLENIGLLSVSPQRDERDPYAREQIIPTTPLTLNEHQARAVASVAGALNRAVQLPAASNPEGDAPSGSSATFLLHGVTGSGKTEVYLQAIGHTLSQGRGAIVLVPEISLTPQTVERFKARFSSGPNQTLVAVLHSHLSAGERHDEWHKIRQGRARIAIGARSAIFAPVEPLGLIIVDEEHEHSYKQEETPRYHARDVAVMRGQRERAVVLLGPATPSMESYHNALHGKYSLLELPARVTETRLPVVRVIDMRAEQRQGRRGAPPIFAAPLREAITQRLERGEQTMLFLNRRGYSPMLQCEKCGWVAGCPNCSVSLTYHRAAQRLLCHVCSHAPPAPARCPKPQCLNPAIRYSGLGTERVEEALSRMFPRARVRRMDSDTLKRKEDYRTVLNDFKTGKIDILVGTQMIAKGLHFPNVTLVGIVHADLSLHIPDFRAGERTFQLLTQVSGRAGRGDVHGEVFVQTFTPFHPAIQFARRHDFLGFYDQEAGFREQLSYPPFARIALVTLKGRNEDKVKFAIRQLRKTIETSVQGCKDLIIDGPSPAPLARAEQFYRHQLMLRTRNMSRLSLELAKLDMRQLLPEDLSLAIDVDPAELG